MSQARQIVIALAQMQSGDDVTANLEVANRLLAEAVHVE